MGNVLHRRKAFRGGGLSPSDLSNRIQGFKASIGVFSDAGTTPAVDDDDVQEWHDQSASGDDATKTTSNQPRFETNGINSLDTVDFDHANSERLESTASSSDEIITIIAVVKSDTVSSVRTIYGSSSAGGVQFRADGSTLQWNKQGVAVRASSSGYFSAGASVIIGFTIDSGGNWEIFKNGASEATGSTTPDITAGRTLILGSRDSGNEPWDGFISEFHLYDTDHSSDDVISVMDTLNAEYSIY